MGKEWDKCRLCRVWGYLVYAQCNSLIPLLYLGICKMRGCAGGKSYISTSYIVDMNAGLLLDKKGA